MSSPKKLKVYIVRKYVRALSAEDAIRKEKLKSVDDVWLDEDYKKEEYKQLPTAIGFVQQKEE